MFHELCHAITEGEAALRKPDWDLDNVPEHVVREHACSRAGVFGGSLRLWAVMAPTTPYRDYYASLPGDPLLRAPADDGDGGGRRPRPRALRIVAWRGRSNGAGEMAAAIGVVAAPGATGTHLVSPRHRRRAAARAWLYEGGRVSPSRVAVERPRERRRRAHRAAPGLRARGAGRRLPHLRRKRRGRAHSVTVSMLDPWSGGARSDRAPRRAFRDSPGGRPVRGAEGGRREQLLLRDLREPAPSLPRIRGGRPPLSGRAPACRAERDAAAARAMSPAPHG